jgi:uncharacterized membrane protein
VNVVEETAEIDAPAAEVFAYIDDFSNAREWLYGLKQIEPVGGVAQRGVGAQYEGVMKVGVSLKSTIECTDWEQDRLIEITSIKGIRNTQRWTFEPLADDRCRLHAHITYELPGGPAGKAMGKAVNPVVGIAIKHTTEKLVSKFAT